MLMDSKDITSEHPGNEECIINGIPRDLIEQIFLKLPVSSLLWCLGVCKQWHKIIRSPQFVAAHLQRAPCCTLLFAPQKSTFKGLYPSDAILFDEALSPSTWAVPVIGPDEILCGSCNGLLCLYTDASTIKIANLATGECLHLEKPVKNLRGDHFSFYSFGFHPVTKEYKVAHFLCDHCPYAAGSFSAIQVYTLGDDKWEFVRTPEDLSLKFEKNSAVVNVDGKMYWLTEDKGSSWHHAVLSFDFSEKSFAVIQLPIVDLEDYAVGCPRQYWITEIDGEVCVATAQTKGHLPRVLMGKLQIWTLSGRLEQRWIQKYNIQLPSHTIRGLPFVHDDKIVIRGSNANLYSYKVPGKSFEIELNKMVKIFYLSHRSRSNIRFNIFVRSLVPLDVYRNAAIVRKPNHKEGWNSKKWQAWEHGLCKREEICNNIYQLVPEVLALCMKINHIRESLPKDSMTQPIGLEVDHMLQHLPVFPDQHPKPLRRLNCVGQSQQLKKFMALVDRVTCIVKAISQLKDDSRRTQIYTIKDLCLEGYALLKRLQRLVSAMGEGNSHGLAGWQLDVQEL